jgi:hypothetical protein
MSKKATLSDLRDRAQKAVEQDESFIYDVAVENGQILANVKHTEWFINEVCICLCNDYKKYSHLLTEVSE